MQLHKVKNDRKEVEDRLSDDQKKKLDDAVGALEEAIKNKDAEQITKKTTDLVSISAQVLNEVKPETTTESKPSDENIVDAEFTETKSEK